MISSLSSIKLILSHAAVCFTKVLTGLSLMMRAGSASMSVLTEVVFAPVFSTGGGVAFCKKKQTKKKLIRKQHPTKDYLVWFAY